MKIEKLILENFKGVKDRQELEIKPITIFCGPNSSGKSSCIHALAALAQTMKLSNTQVPIVLDDEFAQIHLGRFMDVVHSRSIDDSFRIGVGLDSVKYIISATKPSPKVPPSLAIEVEYKAKGNVQEVYIQSAKIDFRKQQYFLSKVDEEFTISQGKNPKQLPFNMISTGKFGFRPKDVFEKAGKPNDEIMQAFFLGENINRNLSEALTKVLYLGPFRQGPLRRYPTRGSQPSEVGAAGEAAIPMLANEFSRSDMDHPNLEKISEWIDKMGLGKRVVIAPVANTDLYDVSLNLDDGASLSLPDLGYGISQVLPVLVQCSFAPRGSTLLFEQPELHLHEGAARKLGAVFVDVVKEKNITILAETHSPYLVMEILQCIRDGLIDKNDFVLYDVCRRDGQSVFKKVLIETEDDGSLWLEHPWTQGLER